MACSGRASAISCILGRNGVGKTTLIRALMGMLPDLERSLTLDHQDISALPVHRMLRCGVALVPEDRGVFPSLTVLENLKLAAHNAGCASTADFDSVYTLFPDLAERSSAYSGNLSGGQQEMLAVARGLVTRPKVLILDEPTHGLSPLLAERIVGILPNLKQQGVAVILVEQSVELALSVADRVTILHKGAIVFEGPAAALQQDETLIDRFLHVGVST